MSDETPRLTVRCQGAIVLSSNLTLYCWTHGETQHMHQCVVCQKYFCWMHSTFNTTLDVWTCHAHHDTGVIYAHMRAALTQENTPQATSQRGTN